LDGDFGVTANIEKKYNYLESGIQDIKILGLTLLPQTPSLFNGLVCSNNKCSFHQIPNYNSPNQIRNYNSSQYLSELDKIFSKRGETSIQKSYERAIKAHQKEEEDRLWEMNRTVLVFSETSPIIEVVKRRYGEGYLIESKGKEYSIPKGIQIETLNRSECERLIAFVEEERKKVQEKQNRQRNSRRRNRRY
jgi:bifunctional ADP-heptose synthase (sugar kinase/adenylyltransferase)